MKSSTPKYVIDIMSRARFAKGYGDPGYTIEIAKRTRQTLASTFEKEIDRLAKYVERDMDRRIMAGYMGEPTETREPTIIVQNVPKKTHYCDQYAVVTIYDPVMKDLEKYIKE